MRVAFDQKDASKSTPKKLEKRYDTKRTNNPRVIGDFAKLATLLFSNKEKPTTIAEISTKISVLIDRVEIPSKR